jgi:2'-5' RNA ligase
VRSDETSVTVGAEGRLSFGDGGHVHVDVGGVQHFVRPVARGVDGALHPTFAPLPSGLQGRRVRCVGHLPGYFAEHDGAMVTDRAGHLYAVLGGDLASPVIEGRHKHINISLVPPDELKAPIAQRRRALARRYESALTRQLQPHVTLKTVGNPQRQHVSRIVQSVASIAADTAPIKIDFDGLQFGGIEPGRGGIYIRVAQPNDALKVLHLRLLRALRRYDREDRKYKEGPRNYKPHLTVLYEDVSAGAIEDARRRLAWWQPRESFVADRVFVFARTGPTPYRLLEVYDLAGAPPPGS